MVNKKFSSIRPVGDSEMAETSLIGGPPQGPREPLWLRKCLELPAVLLGLTVFAALCLIVQNGYCLVLASKTEAILEPEFKLISATVSLHQLTSKLTNVEWEVTLLAINPNPQTSLNFRSSEAKLLFYLHALPSSDRGWLPNFYVNNGTQKVISFRLNSVRLRNDPVVTTAVSELGRPPWSLRSFGLRINIFYEFENKRLCYLDCRGGKYYWWEHVTFLPKGTSKGRSYNSS